MKIRIQKRGRLFASGGVASLIGTAYAETHDAIGTANFAMDDCFVSNLATGLFSLTQTSYPNWTADRGQPA